MEQYVGIWIDTKQAVIIKLLDKNHSIKKIESNINIQVRIPGETKKYGRFGNQYLTYEKNRKNKKKLQTQKFIKSLFKEFDDCEGLVIFGPSKMKKKLQKALKLEKQYASKIIDVVNSDSITDNQMVAWVKNFFQNLKQQTTP